ncbi:hypothetical protein H0X06_06630 [Candidatus Dependentiae bacterium]|nr:hypothetical protein [Candidatus Dependentiae bacterium]
MMEINKQSTSKSAPHTKVRSYQEVVDYLDKHWFVNNTSKTLDRVKQLDAALGNPSTKVNAVLIAGTNGKSLTVYLTSKLLTTEGLKVGSFTSPHILTYNERITTNLEAISNKAFTEIGNEVINMAESLQVQAYSHELLTLMSLLYFVEQKVDVAVLEVNKGGTFDAVNICNALVASVTRVTPANIHTTEDDLMPIVQEMMGIVKPNTFIVSGDQSKNNLQKMHEITNLQGGHWAMPIRKLAPLNYPYEQLHGRCAALAERVAQMFVEEHYNKDATITRDSLLSKQKGKRGRPTLDDKRKADLEKKRTIDQYWKTETCDLPGHFESLETEKPTILLDTASNIDAFDNILLGIRLLQYKRPLKGLFIIMAAAKDTMHNEEFLKLVRYFFKKTSGQMLLCPIESPLPGVQEEESWDVEKVTNDISSMKVKARACKDFEEALAIAKKSIQDERHGLIVVTGSHSIVNTYWRHKGIKKLN